MSKENTQVFGPGAPQPEQRQPDNKELQKILPAKKLAGKIFDFFSIEQQAKKTIAIRNQEQQALEDNVPRLLKQFNKVSGLANNGHVDKITTENFPTIPKDELEEIRYIGYTTRIIRLRTIAKSSNDPLVQESFSKEADSLTKLRDETIKKNHSKIIEASEETITSGAEIKIPQPRQPLRTGQYL